MSLELCRVVLVEPQIAGNIGAAARVMHNMGLNQLVLVKPQVDPRDRNAQQFSTHGEHILDAARIVDDFDDAVADCVVLAATSARTGGLFRRQNIGAPDEIMPQVTTALHAQRPAALIFGPERTGLTNEQITRCHYLIHVPTSEIYPALNLAQAIAICLYELRRSWLQTLPDPDALTPEPIAAVELQERMFAQLENALKRIHFLYGDKADALMHAVRHIFAKASLTEMEVKVLLGLARQIHWFADHGETGLK